MYIALIIFAIFLVVMSIITFVFYANDKKKAIKGQWRTKEKTLLRLSFFGGAIGGLIAMYTRRHKNDKNYFVITNVSGLAWQLIVLVILALFAFEVL